MKDKIQYIQENINRIKNLIQLSNKDDNYDPEKLKKHNIDLIEYQKELSRLMRLEWEEKYERLDYGDDR